MVWGLLAQAGRGERTKGVWSKHLEEAGLTVDYLEIDDATNADAYSRHTNLRWLRVRQSGRQVGGDRSRRSDVNDWKPIWIRPVWDRTTFMAQALTYHRQLWKQFAAAGRIWLLTSSSGLQGYLPILQICLTNNYALHRFTH